MVSQLIRVRDTNVCLSTFNAHGYLIQEIPKGPAPPILLVSWEDDGRVTQARSGLAYAQPTVYFKNCSG